MTITNGNFQIHQINADDFCVLCDAESLVLKVARNYEADDVLMNPNTGEVITVEELRRLASVLDFLSTTRVVEVTRP